MAQVPIEIKNKHVAILRCRTWCDWPESGRYVSRGYKEPLHLPNGDPVYLSVHIVTYGRRKRPEIELPRPLAATSGPIVWRGHMDSGYWLGLHFVKAPEDTIPVTFHYEPPYEGDIDIQLHIGLASEATADELIQLAAPVCTSMLAFVNLALGELAIPVAPVQVRELGSKGSSFATSIVVAVRERGCITEDLAKQVADGFVYARADMSPVEVRAVSAAARRYLTSLTETDAIDKYCDLWESCEFSAMFESAKGGKVGKIALALASHLRRCGVDVTKTQVERGLKLKDLYETRGRIVHNAVDSAGEIAEKTKLLEAVAAELLRYRFGLPCLTNGRICDSLSIAFGATTAHRHATDGITRR